MNRYKTLVVLIAAALLAFFATACGDDIKARPDASNDVGDDEDSVDPDTPGDVDADLGDEFQFGPGVTGTLDPTGSTVAAEGEEQLDLNGASVSVADGLLSDALEISISGTDSIVPEGFIAVGPAVTFSADAARLPGWADFQLPFRSRLMPENASARNLQIFARRATGTRVLTAPFPNMQEDMEAARVTYRSTELATYQLAVRADAGQSYERPMTYRSITGISMGAGAALMIAMRHPEQFDSVGALGGAADWIYLQHYLRDKGLGGFCPAPQFGECPTPDPTEEFEIDMSYNQWHSPSGDGNGGTFDRSEYVRIFRDLAYSFGNTASYNPDSPYRAAGVPREELLRPISERCAETPEDTFTIETGYYDDEYNPDGTLPVILFCDGEDGPPRGDFDDSKPHSMPTEVLMAVDVNGNGRRDADEPVIRNSYEPYEDVGVDGVPSQEEEGYDPMTNPDPADDDYHWLWNPRGTEGNWLFEEGEPYEDVGIDGVPDTDSSGYDYGEANGRFDYNPNLLSLIERSPRWTLRDLTAAQRDGLTVYVDGGIRDLFNFDVAGTHYTGALQDAGENVRMYDTFPELADLEPGASYDVTRIDFTNLGEHVFLRYGDPDAPQALIEDGDGKHVGSNGQAAQRFTTMFGYLTNLWVNGNYELVEPPYSLPTDVGSYQSEALNGAMVTFGIAFPPDYDKPEFANETYPVIYLLHGYGQGPEDLPITGVLLANFQASGFWPKAIIVYPDGFCGENDVVQCNDGEDNDQDGLFDTDDPDCASPDGVSESAEPVAICNDGVDNDGDGLVDSEDQGCKDSNDVSEADCVQGNFFTNHVAWPAGENPGPQIEDAFFELVEHVEDNYRVKTPENVTWRY